MGLNYSYLTLPFATWEWSDCLINLLTWWICWPQERCANACTWGRISRCRQRSNCFTCSNCSPLAPSLVGWKMLEAKFRMHHLLFIRCFLLDVRIRNFCEAILLQLRPKEVLQIFWSLESKDKFNTKANWNLMKTTLWSSVEVWPAQKGVSRPKQPVALSLSAYWSLIGHFRCE